MSAARPEGSPDDRRADEGSGAPKQERRRLVDLTRVEAGEPERRAPFRRFAEGDPES